MSSESFNVVSIPSEIPAGEEDDGSDDDGSTSSSSTGDGEKGKQAVTAAAAVDGDPSDIQSLSFDPEKALLDNNFDLSFAAGVDPLDNVEKFAKTLEGGSDDKVKTKVEGKKQTKAEVEPTARRFEESQMPIKGKAKRPRNVLHYMKKCKEQGGPMAALASCALERTKVKVLLRGAVSMRGSCTGFLVAFDKHWNVALVDVDEVFTRRRHGKPSLDEEFAEKLQVGEKASRRSETVGASLLRVVKQRRKTELCERHVPQIVIRGEHVAAIVILK